jgi:tRNA(Ile)-lysidine synthetase-like protein
VKAFEAGSRFRLLLEQMQARVTKGNPSRMWVALSGGLDSMVLLHLCRQLGVSDKLGVLHVNYRLRGAESDGDADFVRKISESFGLECRILTVDPLDHPPEGRGLQNWARDLRYRWFREQMLEGEWLALAHHADDLAENVLMRITRGAGMNHLLGMKEFEAYRWRPLLGVWRAELEEEADRQKIPHRVDSSNAKLIYSRNVIRHRILPELERMYPGARENLLTLAGDAEALTGYYRDQRQPWGPVLGADALREQPAVLAQQTIGDFLGHHGVTGPVSRRHRVDLATALMTDCTLVLALDERHRAVVRAGELWVEASTVRRSARWSQYAGAVGDNAPKMSLAPMDVYQTVMPLDAD